MTEAVKDKSSIQPIDLSPVVWPLRWLRYLKYVLVIYFSPMALDGAYLMYTTSSLDDVIAGSLMCLIAASLAYLGWRNIGNLGFYETNSWIWAISIVFVSIISAFFALVFFAQPSSPENLTVMFVWLSVLVLALVVALAELVARYRKLTPVGASVSTLAKQRRGGNSSPRLPAKRPWLAAAIVLAAIGLYYVATPLIDGAGHLDESDQRRAWTLVITLMAFAVVGAMHYLQPNIDTLLASDTRPPIVYLRSFADDRSSFSGWMPNYSAQMALLDYSLESRLAHYFSRSGPFIAIGKPGDKSIHLGAIRAQLSDSEWQDKVIDWLDRAQLIVVMVGTSKWLAWELDQILSRGYASKSMVLLPDVRGFWFTRGRRREERVNHLVALLAATAWGPAISELSAQARRRLRAVALREGGGVVTILSRSGSRDSHHLAAIVADHVIRGPDAPLAVGDRPQAIGRLRPLAMRGAAIVAAATCLFGAASAKALYWPNKAHAAEAWRQRQLETIKLESEGDYVGVFLTASYNLVSGDDVGKAQQQPSELILKLSTLYEPIAVLYAERQLLNVSETRATECDRLASYKYDPLRVAKDVADPLLEANLAISACGDAIRNNQSEPRFFVQRARAHTRQASILSDSVLAEGQEPVDAANAAAKADLQHAVELKYPGAFILTGTTVEAFNRALYCCYSALVDKLLDEGKVRGHNVKDAIRELLIWSAALGSQEAKDALDRLADAGSIKPFVGPLPKADFASVPPWLTGAATN